MEELLSFQKNLLSRTPSDWRRYLYPRLTTEERLIGVSGLRGVGKTTMLLQYLAYGYPERNNGLYVTADHPYFYNNTLFDLASEWYRHDGKLLLIDEVHKYPNWSRELKLIYDGHPDLQVIFTSSSALDLYRGESDLSRRLITYTLHGLSFREYLSLIHGITMDAYSLPDILTHSRSISNEMTARFNPILLFKSYLKEGYFPFIKHIDRQTLDTRLLQILNTVLERDLAFVQDYSSTNIVKIKKLLGVIGNSAPFEPNISSIAQKLGIGRNTVITYLKHLNDAHIINLINRSGKGVSVLQKPDKIYLENTAFAFAFWETPDIGTIRETFFLNQLINAGHKVALGQNGDFVLNHQITVEVGGKNKKFKQIRDATEAYLALDEIDTGYDRKIPLWLFGFLY